MRAYDTLLTKLDAFIRKFYFNQVVKGSALFVIVAIALYFVLVLAEAFFYMPVGVKIPLVIGLCVAAIFVVVKYIVWPLLQMQRLGKRISYEQAAIIVGKHFGEVNDKIVNVLQLKEQSQTNQINTLLLEASIDQKSAQLASIPLANAIDLAKNKQFLPYVLGLVSLLILGFLIMPNWFKGPTERLLHPATAYSAPAPFSFELNPNSLKALVWQEHTINLRLVGEKLPEDVYIVLDGEKLLMTPNGDHKYAYSIPKVSAAHEFYFDALGYKSEKYKLQINFLPVINEILVSLKYPQHIGKAAEQLTVFSDLTVPEGTIIHWKIATQHTSQIDVVMDSTVAIAASSTANTWSWEKQIVSPSSFWVLLKGDDGQTADTFSYTIAVIKDNPPVLDVQVKRDTIIGDQMVFTGLATDDYGIQSVSFHYDIINAQNTVVKKHSLALPVGAKLSATISHYFDAGSIGLAPDQNLKMYITVCDNDIINGGKCVSSPPVLLKEKTNTSPQNPSDNLEENAAKMQESLAATQSKQKSIQKDLEDLKAKMLDKKSIDWQQENQLQQITEEQLQLKKQMEAISKRFQEQQKQTAQQELSSDLQEKQDEVKKQIDQIINKELQEQLARLEELKAQRNPQKAFEQLQKMEQQNKLFQMNMERVQALIKQLELQIAMEQTAAQLEKFIAEEQEITKKTEQGRLDEQLAKEQKNLQEAFEKAMNEASKQLKQKEENAESNESIGQDLQNASDKVAEEMSNSSEAIQNKQQQSAKNNQQKATQRMQQMAKSLKDKAGGMDMEQLDIDIKATRQLLTNLLRFSFDQEALIEKVKTTPIHSQNFLDINKEQGRLGANARILKDSLYALSKRVFQIAASVNKEATELEMNINQAIASLQERYASNAQVKQQYAMTNANNLALILNELLENLMNDMSEASGAEGSSGKPKSGKPSSGEGKEKGKGKGQGEGAGDQLKDIITKQQQLGQGMQQGQGKQGNKGQQGDGQGSGGGAEGGKDGTANEYGDAKELARMAREQAQLRQQINQLNTLLNNKGIKGQGKQMAELQSLMDKNETDLVNRRLTRELLLRQQEIMTKLLETEKAVREQEQDNQRQGNTATEVQRPIPPDLKDFMKQQETLFEQYETEAPVLQPYYKKINEQYLQKVK